MTLQPRTLEDDVDIVKGAKADNTKVQCVAGGYTWSLTSVFEDDGLLVFVNKMTKICTPIDIEGQGWTVEMETGVTPTCHRIDQMGIHSDRAAVHVMFVSYRWDLVENQGRLTKDNNVINCGISKASKIGFEKIYEYAAHGKYPVNMIMDMRFIVHWAKLWEHIPGIGPYLREQAGPQLDQFESILKKYDPQGMFLNETFVGILRHK
ncbi:hypothetical protein EC957_002268 [Mortierella hygrophila]|uniref:Uncharacterized protein n=1 Tax=Mortierella hygrophila TaxID=979708 RepID=A0A9P6F3N6_9FUNG|nr:hypothetical protein EC957_002268 [Mortierella hygrophila]